MKKFIKGFLKFLLTIFLIVLLTFLGLTLSLKNIVVDITDSVLKNEISTSIVNTVENTTKIELPEDIVKEIDEAIKDNQEIKNIAASSLNMLVELICDENANTQISITNNIESIITSGIEILNENGIKIDKNVEQKITDEISSKEVNDIVTEVSKNIRDEVDEETKLVFEIYNFLTSEILKLILIALILTTLLFIALLKKSSYLWLSNFAISTIISGVIVGIIFPFIINNFSNYLDDSYNITISTNSLNNYGYILIILGVIAIILDIIISQLTKKKNINQNLENSEK